MLSVNINYKVLSFLCQYHGKESAAQDLQAEFSANGDVRIEDLVRAARSLNFKSKYKKLRLERLSKTPLPLMACLADGTSFVLAKYDGNQCVTFVPGQAPKQMSYAELEQIWSGDAILLVPDEGAVTATTQAFGLSWFVPAFLKYWRLLLELLGVSILLSLIAIITPLMFQIVIDRVMGEQLLSTLYVVICVLVGAAMLEFAIGGLREHAINHTGARIDAELGGKLFNHLLKLPLPYFQSRPAGQTAARVMCLEDIRQFLTGSTLSAVIDTIFIIALIAVLFILSVPLAWVVVALFPLFFISAFFISPILRARMEEKFERNAKAHSFLIESVSGAETIKSLALGPLRDRQWHNRVAQSARANLRSANVNIWGMQIFVFISKIVTVAILFFGALEVIGEGMTVGTLVAFNMIAQQASAPILRMANLWQDFQQMRISVARLGDILNCPAEYRPASKRALPRLKGKIIFDDVCFQYPESSAKALDHFALEIQPGEIVGIVGRSGCGKSTLTKVLQRLYTPQYGNIVIDGNDISLMDPDDLRRQVRVVLQESHLFSGTVRENIAFCMPSASLDEVMSAAKLAGIHDDIMRLAAGYDTPIEERGQNISGGQKQRLAIARAILSDPAILIMDEATSALDYESELHIQAKMAKIAEKRTVLIIAHRLSALRPCNRIITLDRGRVTQDGKPQLLMKVPGFFRELCESQIFQEAS